MHHLSVWGSPPLTRKEMLELIKKVPGWSLANGHLTRTYDCRGAGACIEFFSEVMTLAMQEGHIPDIAIRDSKHFIVSFYTYAAGGLTMNDFIRAAKLNAKKP